MNKPNRKSIRLKGYDYTSPGAYFITICTSNHKYLFGDIIDDKMILNDVGDIVYSEWFKTETLRPDISLDAFVIMLNHVHGIIIKNGVALTNSGTKQRAPTMTRHGVMITCANTGI